MWPGITFIDFLEEGDQLGGLTGGPASGFSTSTCLPTSSAWRTSESSVLGGVAIATASTAVSASASSNFFRQG